MRLAVAVERWPIAGAFRISRGAKTEAEVVVASVTADGFTGRGECVPYKRYGETIDGVVAAIERLGPPLEWGLSRLELQAALPPGAARNALDCALWDLEAKRAGTTVFELAGLPAPHAVTTAYTLSLDAPDLMGLAAARAGKPLLKLKLGGDGADLDRVAAVHAAAPQARLIVDANEAWAPGDVVRLAGEMARHGVTLIEQPVPADLDAALEGLQSPVALCADESFHVTADLERLARRYSHVNVKLDKTGGLTEAIAAAARARELGLGLMIGCMVGTSLGMAPAALLAGGADYVDLDGPLLLARDRTPGLRYEGAVMYPPTPALWG
jgi:L-alanine-DL-glutamate epimerase-like enolase superfamily enzyme